MLKALIGFCVYALTAALLGAAVLGVWGYQNFNAAGPLLEPITLDIQRGAGLSSIARELERQGVISNRYIFLAGARIMGEQANLKAGEYNIPAAISPRDVLVLLAKGDTVQRRFTIREGLTSYEVVQLLGRVDGLEGEITTVPLEGSLLPNTWDYRRGENRNAVIKRLQEEMSRTLDDLWQNRAPDLPITTKKEALILASIIEKETGKPGEHARIAGVFINRLKKNMPLQTDPTVIYAITKGRHDNNGRGPLGRRLLRKDLQYQSPYNTYLNVGLPPGPIANPGIAAIKAALNPESHDYLYFVADGTGGHVFSKTLAEHNRNAAKWRRIRAGQ